MSNQENLPAEPVWTRFFDMCSGGGEKLSSSVIWIEAEELEAISLFKQIFNRDPHNVTCNCCGEDYTVYERTFEPEPGHFIVSRSDIEKFKETKT